MKTNKRVMLAKRALAAAMLVGAALSAGCQGAPSAESSPMPGPSVMIGVNALYPDYSLTDLMARSNIAVIGEVVGYSEPFVIDPVSGADPMIFTDVYVRVDEALKGDPLEIAFGKPTPSQGAVSLSSAVSAIVGPIAESDDTLIAVRLQGGRYGSVGLINESSPDLSVGDTALMFLYRIADGTGYNTEGNHYYLITGLMSAWKQVGESFVQFGGARETTAAEASAALNDDRPLRQRIGGR